MTQTPGAGGPVADRPNRYPRSASGMVGALVVCLLVIGGFVAFRALNRTDLDVKPSHVNYLAEVRYLQSSGASGVVYPARLPDGWTATRMDASDSTQPDIVLSMLTGDQQYVGFVQSGSALPVLLTQYVDPAPTAGSPVRTGGRFARWDTWTDSGGDTALGTRWHHESLLVFGSAPRADLVALARTLTTRR